MFLFGISYATQLELYEASFVQNVLKLGLTLVLRSNNFEVLYKVMK